MHDFLGIKDGVLKLDAGLLDDDDGADPSRSAGDKVTVQMDNADAIFADARNLSLEQLGVFLNEKAIKIKESHNNFRGNKDASISEMHKFVKQIPHLKEEFKSLNHHIHIAELVKRECDTRAFIELWKMERGMLEGEVYLDHLEDLVTADTDGLHATKVLRLLSLQSQTSGGLRSNKYDQLKRVISQVYGFEYMFTLQLFEKIGLLKRKDSILSVVDTSTSVFQAIKKPLKLINESVNMARPDDISYVTAGYAPLSVRIIQALMTQGSGQQFSNEMKQLPGTYVEFYQHQNSASELCPKLAR